MPLLSLPSRPKKKATESDQQPKRSQKQPGSSESASDFKAEALLAFRTITTMLSLLQSTVENDTPTSDDEPTDRANSRKTLSILNALAAIVTREHGVAAVVSNVSLEDIEVVISVIHDREPLTISQRPGRLGVMRAAKELLRLVTAQNPRYDPLPSQAQARAPMITSDPEAMVARHLKRHASEGHGLLVAFLMNDWCGLEDTQQSYNTHIWMISKLLGHSPRTFTYYIIATCYLRMIRRLNYNLSCSFRHALEKLQTVEFSEQHYDSSASEKANDEAFLSELQKSAASLLRKKTPNLLDGRDPGNIYTVDTCTEFHLLLCELLQQFSEHLTALQPIQKRPTSREQIFGHLDLIIDVGTLLRLMVRGSAIKRHLQVIDKVLPDRADLVKASSGDEDEDSELVSLDNGKSLPKWEACVEWLELMVTHFDAIQTLIRFVSHHSTGTIDLKVLSLVPPDNKMLTWKELLNHKSHFPGDRPGATAEDLIAFLSPIEDENQKDETDKKEKRGKGGKKEKEREKGVTAESVVLLMNALRRFKFPDDGPCGDAIDGIIHQIGLIDNCTSTGSQSYTNNIVEELRKFKGRCLLYEQDEAIVHITRISFMIKTLRANAMLRTSLRKGSPLDLGAGFKGDYHCEGSLTAFCTYDAVGFVCSSNVGVSKPCCPICAYLLKLLKPQFAFTAMHHKITAYALPDSLPIGVIVGMISKFGGQLREELVRLKERTEVLQSCSDSIGSKGLSDSSSAHTYFDVKVGSDLDSDSEG